jgi:hypothetical protein
MKKKLKLTGENVAAAALMLGYFLPWITTNVTSASGFNFTTIALSPGLWSSVLEGFSKILLLLLILVPASAVFILWQNYAPDTKYAKYIKPAHFLPLPVIVFEIGMIYTNISDSLNKTVPDMYSFIKVRTPSFFDLVNFGFYLSVAASLYLLLINLGIIKDKNFSTQNSGQPQPASSANQSNFITIKTSKHENEN